MHSVPASPQLVPSATSLGCQVPPPLQVSGLSHWLEAGLPQDVPLVLKVHEDVQQEAGVPFAAPASHCSPASRVPLPHNSGLIATAPRAQSLRLVLPVQDIITLPGVAGPGFVLPPPLTLLLEVEFVVTSFQRENCEGSGVMVEGGTTAMVSITRSFE